MAVPYTFASATGSIPLSQLDTNFATAIVIGNTSVYLGNTITTLNNITLANATISSVVFASGASLANVTLTGTTTVTGNIAVSGNSTVDNNLFITSGNLLVGRTSLTSYNSGVKGSALNTNGQGIFEIDYANSPGMTLNVFNCGSSNANQFQFYRNNIAAGLIATDSSAQTYYTASSDYRLKSNAQPLTGSGTFIDSLQPKSWVWIVNGKRGAGFIAHEAAQTIPSSVFGEKDDLDNNGNPVYQSMSAASAEMIANIISELQSLRARVAALEAKP